MREIKVKLQIQITKYMNIGWWSKTNIFILILQEFFIMLQNKNYSNRFWWPLLGISLGLEVFVRVEIFHAYFSYKNIYTMWPSRKQVSIQSDSNQIWHLRPQNKSLFKNIARHVMICKLSFVTRGRVDVNKAKTVWFDPRIAILIRSHFYFNNT